MPEIDMESSKRSGGFTLIELMVATSLMAVLFFALASFYMLVDDSWDRGSSLLNLQRDGSYALLEMATSVRMGSSVQINPSTQLVIKDASGATIGGYYRQAGDNTLRDNSGAKVISSLVDSLQFTLSNRTVFVTLVLTDSDQQEKAYFSTAASLRN